MSRTSALAAVLAMAALGAAGQTDDKNATADRVNTAVKKLKATDPKIKLKALEELTPLAADSPQAAAALCEAIVSPSRPVSVAAFEALEKSRPHLYRPLASLKLDTDPAVRVQALNTLVRLGESAVPTLPVLHAMLRAELKNGPDPATHGLTPLQRAGFEAVRTLGPDDPDTVKLYKSVAAPEHRFVAARREALAALANWAGENEKRRKDACSAVKAAMADPACLPQCIEILGEFGPAAREVLPTLKKLKLSRDANLRDLAAAAVAKIEAP